MVLFAFDDNEIKSANSVMNIFHFTCNLHLFSINTAL